MIIYSEHITPRLQYIVDFIFQDILGSDVVVTDNLKEINNTNENIINYSNIIIDNAFWIKPHELLFQNNIKQQIINVDLKDNVSVFFQTGEDADISFDIFAAAFYLVSRYEEYLPHKKDNHDRFEYKESLAYKNDFLKQPIVDIWVQKLKTLLIKKFSDLSFKEREYKYISTIDVDIAWAFKNRGFFRTMGAIGKSLLQLNFKDNIDRFKVLMRLKEDPYYTFQFIDEIHQKAGIRPLFFVQIGNYGKYDKNISIKNRAFNEFLDQLSEMGDIGVHPSYASFDNYEKLEKEVLLYKSLIKPSIVRSRQHFLRFSIPESYQYYEKYGVEEEYSMGYAGCVGFRAGTCTPFYFYDLSNEIKSTLKVIPFQAMDNTLKNYMGLSFEEAVKEIKSLVNEVKNVNGTFVSLWHNHSFSEYREWEGWSNLLMNSELIQ